MQTSTSTNSDPNCLKKVIDRTECLSQFTKKIAIIQSANHILSQILPKDLMQYCSVANIQSGVVTLYASGANWATHLRYYHQQILTALRQHDQFGPIAQLRLRTSPPKIRTSTKIKQPIRLSATASKVIYTSANSISHPALKKALQRLASRKNKQPTPSSSKNKP